MPDRLEIDHLHKRFGEVVALDDMTFEAYAGEMFGFVGANGAGKTTTMRVALGVLAADKGEVRWAGKPLDARVRRDIGYMPEERGLYPRMKVGEQLIYLARLHGMGLASARRSMEAWTERLGVDHRRDDDVQKLSLGNQQRVQLAAALVHDPHILVLDEPFSGLDPVAVDVMSGVLKEKVAQGVPVVFSSHQLDLVERLCDRVGIVRSGSMVACGTIDELRAGADDTLVVDVPQADPSWASSLPGVSVVRQRDGRSWLRVPDDLDDQIVLRAALQAGAVREFSRHRPPLTDLFRDLVTIEGSDAAPTASEGQLVTEGARS
jgi:ABC-2 type transport system ATP-binding protein